MLSKIYMNSLLDTYGELLTGKQQDVCKFYYGDDLSLSEIGEIMGVSRAAVHDIIKRCEKELQHYEEMLKIVSDSEKRMKLYRELLKPITETEKNSLVNQCIQIEMGGQNCG